MRENWRKIGRMLIAMTAVAAAGAASAQTEFAERMARQWPITDFTRIAASVDVGEILSGGPGRDGIPAIGAPQFIPATQALERYAGREPVISVNINGDARAYPLQVLTWHEIANDEVGGAPIAVTYCPLCNAGIVFDRRVAGRVLTFGVSGLLRRSDMVMFDRETESWWQQFTGAAIVGEMVSAKLRRRPARIEALSEFVTRHAQGKVLIPSDPTARPYGRNPYASYDNAVRPFLFQGDLPENIEPMAYVVVVGDTAWSLEMLRREGEVTEGDIRLRQTHELASALDSEVIAQGRALPAVVVERQGADQAWEEIPYDVTFAFVFHAFNPEGAWRL